MRIAGLVLTVMAVGGSGSALAQSGSSSRESADATAQEAPEEVVVRGRRLTELRAEVQLKRERAYLIFNGINSDDDFDVYCRKESRSGTNVPQEVCRAQFENRISRAAGQEYLQSLMWRCPSNDGGAGVTQDCIFSNYSAGAIQAAQGVEGQLPGKREQMADEIMRLANENDEFAQSILDWYEANQRYDEARKQRNRRND